MGTPRATADAETGAVDGVAEARAEGAAAHAVSSSEEAVTVMATDLMASMQANGAARAHHASRIVKCAVNLIDAARLSHDDGCPWVRG
ncbi:hypothetical protein GCM10010412_009020 [Nonomuraea recticatena]|uniref:Uncharacterized protein n=1 Tax=Nonomuraea recticatena TaxID=46178 RepID=A0ABN3R8F5_9ACTN